MDDPIPVARSSSNRSGESGLSPISNPTSPSSRSNRPRVRIVTPSISSFPERSEHPNDFDPNNPTQLQAKIYEQLFQLTSQLNNNARSLNTLSAPTPITPAYSPFNFISRWGGHFAQQALSAAAQENDDPMAHQAALDAAEYDALGQQFTTLVIISTFTANLIIGFIALAFGIMSTQIPPQPKLIFEIGMFFALIGMAIHAGVIIISGRCAAIALKHTKKLAVEAQMKRSRFQEEEDDNDEIGVNVPRMQQLDDKDDNKYDSTKNGTSSSERSPPTTKGQRQASSPLPPTQSSPHPPYATHDHCPDDFMGFLRVCEALQLAGTATFFLGVTVLIFLIFVQRIFPILLVGGFVVGTCLLGWLAGFWKISATNQLVVATVRTIGSGLTKRREVKGKMLKKYDGKEKASSRRWFGRTGGHERHDLEKVPGVGRGGG